MKIKVRELVQIVCYAVCLILLASLGYASPSNAGQIMADKKSTVKGTIKSRSGELINVKDSKTGTLVVVSLSESTKIIRKKGAFKFRGSAMDVTAMVPGLGIEAEGVGNAKGQLAASKVTFSPDDFAIEVAEEQQIMANKAAAANAQSSANQGQAEAQGAQTSANNAQSSADQAQSSANQAGALGVMDAAAIGTVNKRVSDLGDYNIVAEAGIYYASDKSALDDAAKADLSKLADVALSTDGYLIEIAGYASSTGTKDQNQKLSEARAAAVTHYLLEVKTYRCGGLLSPPGTALCTRPPRTLMLRDVRRTDAWM